MLRAAGVRRLCLIYGISVCGIQQPYTCRHASWCAVETVPFPDALMTGTGLDVAVDRALKDVNLHKVADKLAGAFSGGMKRRLSVAISFVGNPKVVYLDEPSTVSIE